VCLWPGEHNLLLMSVVAIPFATALLSEYLLAGNGNARSAALVYSAVMLAMSFGFAAPYTNVALHPGLLADGVDPARCADPSCGSVPSALGYMS
jgi:hypothetical protein